MPSCPICSFGGFERFCTSPEGWHYRKCPFCGFVQMERESRMSSTEEKKRYLLHDNSIENTGYVNWLERFLSFALEDLNAAGTAVGTADKGRILDFGSGPEPVMALLLRNRGLPVETEDPYFAPGRREGPFSLILSVEVFEHLADPVAVLDDLSRRLAFGGAVCLSTEFLPPDEELFVSWHYRTDPTHISFFSRRSLELLAETAGMRMVDDDGRRYVRFLPACSTGRDVLV